MLNYILVSFRFLLRCFFNSVARLFGLFFFSLVDWDHSQDTAFVYMNVLVWGGERRRTRQKGKGNERKKKKDG